MAESRSVWGIDIGQSALKAMKLRYVESAEQLVAVAFDYVPYPKILSQPDAIPEEIIPQALETFLSRNDVQGDLIAISVPGQSALTRFIQLPPVEKSKLPEIVKYEARQQIPFALEDVIWDYQPLGAGDDESGYLLDAEVGLFAMKRDQVMQHLRPFLNAKLEVELIQVAPLALYNMLSYDELGIRPGEPLETDGEHVIVLDMGCDNTTLVVSDGVKIWIRNVPLGGNHFTRALTKEMKLSFAKAEHLKCNATKSPRSAGRLPGAASGLQRLRVRDSAFDRLLLEREPSGEDLEGGRRRERLQAGRVCRSSSSRICSTRSSGPTRSGVWPAIPC